MGGIEDLINKYEKIRDEADATILHCLQASGNETVLNIQSRTPVRTGRLKSEMKAWQPQQEGDYYYIDVGNDSTEYCPYIEYGFTKPNGEWYEGKFMINLGADYGRELLHRMLEQQFGRLFNDK